MYITIAGLEGSGKSTLTRNLAKKLNWPYFSVGNMRRAMAAEMNLTLADFNKLAESDQQYDVDVDKKMVKEVNKHENAIVEGRVMYHFFPESFKIYLVVDFDEAAKRLLHTKNKDRKNEAKDVTSLESIKQNLKDRRESDIKRYRKYYNLDPHNQANFDLIIDTTTLQSYQTVTKAYTAVKMWLGLT